MSATDTIALRKRSKVAFGQDYQLEVMLLIADARDVVNQKASANELGITSSQIQPAWNRLVALGLIELRYRDRQHFKHFARKDDTLTWEWARELAGDLWRSTNNDQVT